MINSKYQCLQGGLEKIIIFYINGSTVKRAQSEMPYSLITSPENCWGWDKAERWNTWWVPSRSAIKILVTPPLLLGMPRERTDPFISLFSPHNNHFCFAPLWSATQFWNYCSRTHWQNAMYFSTNSKSHRRQKEVVQMVRFNLSQFWHGKLSNISLGPWKELFTGNDTNYIIVIMRR